jgi:serine/threonine-protein kinase
VDTPRPPDPGSLQLDRQVDALCDRFEAAWAGGPRPVIEAYLSEVPEAARPALLYELARLEVSNRRRAGERPTRPEYRERFPLRQPWWDALLDELLPPEAPFRVTLTVTEGPHRGRSFSFTEHDTFVVGRSPEAHFSLPEDSYFSRSHFLVEINPPLCRLLDLGSKNGTEVNRRRVTAPVDLQDGDEIRGGQTALRVALEGRPGPDATRTLRPAAEPPTRSHPGERAVPGYRLVEELGRGGMGVVYRAVREADGVTVALKAILPAVAPTAEAVGRFLREAAILRGLEHPYIVPFRDMGEAGGLIYFTMDFVPGTDAARIVKEQGPLPAGRAVRLLCQALEALAYAHGRGFVHRDVKPANLLVTEAGGREEVRLADFGLARAYQASWLSGLTLAGTAGGTPAFVAPEQVLNFRAVKPPADQYSAAATLYTLLTGEPVRGRAGSLQELFKRILQEDPVPIRSRRPDIPAALAAAVHRALARRPEERFADVGALRQALLPFAQS